MYKYYYSIYVDGIDTSFFTYSYFEELNIGQWVKINFAGRNKFGLVISKEEKKEFEFEVREIIERADSMFPIPEAVIALFLWISSYYMASFKDVVSNGYPANMKMSESKKCIFRHSFIPLTTEDSEFLDYMAKKKEAAKSTLVQKFGNTRITSYLKKGIIEETKEFRDKRKTKTSVQDFSKIAKKKVVNLTDEQRRVRDEILEGKQSYYLIRGITGSGKTEVYIEICRKALLNNEGAIFLVPEISLTPQMIERFCGEFEDEIAVMHSQMTAKERADEWKRIYTGEKKIVLGVRSAVFAPVVNLKYIIIDEEHETTYKQDSSPRYHARYAAIKRAEIENLKVIMGSATPSIESYYYGVTGIYKLLEIESRYNDMKLPEIEIVDMKKEDNENFSSAMIYAIHQNLKKEEQSLLFLNRKGYSTYVQCKSCGEAEYCPHCSVALNYYRSENKLKCSYCGYERVFNKKCSACNSDKLNYSGQGTEKIEIQLKNLFKNGKIIRVDSETSKEKGAYEQFYTDFLNGKYDILVGTQVISKGLHFPNITFAGIISADGILHFPDFRAGEKTFQLIVQVAGRAGRGEKNGKVIVQTYNPEHYAINYALKSDYRGFYKEEIEMRKELEYPPFGRMINFVISSEKEEGLLEYAEEFYKEIKTSELEIFGPYKAPLYKINKRFRYQIFVKGKREKVLKFKKMAGEVLKRKKDKDFRVTVDVDPVNLL